MPHFCTLTFLDILIYEGDGDGDGGTISTG